MRTTMLMTMFVIVNKLVISILDDDDAGGGLGRGGG